MKPETNKSHTSHFTNKEKSALKTFKPSSRADLRAPSDKALTARVRPRRRHSSGALMSSSLAGSNAPALYAQSGSMMENLYDDMFYCGEYVEVNYTSVFNAMGEQVSLLTRSVVHRSVQIAVAILVSDGVPIRSIWAIEDLLEPDNFGRIANVLAGSDVIHVLIQIAADWVKLTPETLAVLEDIAQAAICNN